MMPRNDLSLVTKHTHPHTMDKVTPPATGYYIPGPRSHSKSPSKDLKWNVCWWPGAFSSTTISFHSWTQQRAFACSTTHGDKAADAAPTQTQKVHWQQLVQRSTRGLPLQSRS
jgi:hypothetical protein